MIFHGLSTENVVANWRFGYRGWIAIGLVSGLLALEFAPLVSGTMALFAAVQLYRNQFEVYGLLIGAFGVICTIVGIVSGGVLLSLF